MLNITFNEIPAFFLILKCPYICFKCTWVLLRCLRGRINTTQIEPKICLLFCLSNSLRVYIMLYFVQTTTYAVIYVYIWLKLEFFVWNAVGTDQLLHHLLLLNMSSCFYCSISIKMTILYSQRNVQRVVSCLCKVCVMWRSTFVLPTIHLFSCATL